MVSVEGRSAVRAIVLIFATVLLALRPVRIGRGFRFSFAYTVDDLETLRDLRRP